MVRDSLKVKWQAFFLIIILCQFNFDINIINKKISNATFRYFCCDVDMYEYAENLY